MTEKPQNNEPDQLTDAELDEYRAGASPVSAAYGQLDQPEPPAALDRAILEEARAAVQPPRQSLLDLDLAFWRHWARPLSAIAIMGFCLAVVLQVMQYASKQPGLPEAGFKLNSQDIEINAVSRPADSSQAPDRQKRSPTALEEIVVTSGKQEEQLQDVPLAIQSLAADDPDIAAAAPSAADADITAEDSALQEILVTARKRVGPDTTVGANALLEWQQGVTPAADTWLAGIDELYRMDEPERAAAELAKMARVYPIQSRQYAAERRSADTGYAAPPIAFDEGVAFNDAIATPESGSLNPSAGADTQTDSLQPEAPQSDLPQAAKAGPEDAMAVLPEPWVWATGIAWLTEQGRNADAAAETNRFRQIYPDYELDL